MLFRAIALVGTPYRYGGNTPQGGFDCSGLVGYVFHDAAGVALPRTSSEMSDLRARKLDRAICRPAISCSSPKAATSAMSASTSASSASCMRRIRGGTVRLDRLDGAWWNEHFVYGKRVR